jgi:DNA-binding transcriptional regulator YiaG
MKRKLVTAPSEARTLASCALKKVREASGLTQEQAAALAGLDPRQVRRWENGEVPLGPLELAELLRRRAA